MGSTEVGGEYKRTSYCVGSKGPLYDISFNSQYVKKNTTIDGINLVEAKQNLSQQKNLGILNSIILHVDGG